MSKYNKALIRDNIKFLASKKGIKIGEVETEAGVSAGYLSRIVNDNNSSNALLDVIMTFADKMDVTVDSLMNVNFSQLSPDEKYLADFFHSLIFKTRGHQINWIAETQDKLSDSTYTNTHPLFQRTEYGQSLYHSYFNRFNRSEENIYYTILNNLKFYMIKVTEESPFEQINAYETYFYDSNQKRSTPLCLIKDDSYLYNIIIELYQTAEISGASVHISVAARNIITNIMNQPQTETNNYSDLDIQKMFDNNPVSDDDYQYQQGAANAPWNNEVPPWDNNDNDEDIPF